jgi:predicted SPOUT superfamily RNA methylase MTH1
VTAVQLARACVVFEIDKIVVLNDGHYQKAMRVLAKGLKETGAQATRVLMTSLIMS